MNIKFTETYRNECRSWDQFPHSSGKWWTSTKDFRWVTKFDLASQYLNFFFQTNRLSVIFLENPYLDLLHYNRGITGKRRLTKEHGSCQDNVDLSAYIDKPSRHLKASSLLLHWPVATICWNFLLNHWVFVCCYRFGCKCVGNVHERESVWKFTSILKAHLWCVYLSLAINV